MEGVGRIPQEGHGREFGYDLREQLQALSLQVRRDARQPGQVPARSREALDQARADRVAYRSHDDGDRRGRALGREGRGRASRDDDIRLEGNEFRDERWEALVRSFGPAVLDREIPALDVAALAKPLAERPDEVSLQSLGGVTEEPDPVHLPRRRRLGDERRSEEASMLLSEEGSLVYHSSTFSARCNSDAGIVRALAFAVLRLITSWNRFGRSIGRSAGRAPFTRRSMYLAACLNCSARFGP